MFLTIRVFLAQFDDGLITEAQLSENLQDIIDNSAYILNGESDCADVDLMVESVEGEPKFVAFRSIAKELTVES